MKAVEVEGGQCIYCQGVLEGRRRWIIEGEGLLDAGMTLLPKLSSEDQHDLPPLAPLPPAADSSAMQLSIIHCRARWGTE